MRESLEGLAGVEAVGNRPRIGIVARHAGIEEVHRDRGAVHTDKVATPHSDGHRTASELDLDVGVESLELLAHLPVDTLLHLTARRVDLLSEKPFVVHQGHAENGKRQVRGSPEKVAGQHAQTTAEAGDLVADGDLHGEVCDGHGPESAVSADGENPRGLPAPVVSRRLSGGHAAEFTWRSHTRRGPRRCRDGRLTSSVRPCWRSAPPWPPGRARSRPARRGPNGRPCRHPVPPPSPRPR